MRRPGSIELIPVADFPIVRPGDCIATLAFECLRNQGLELAEDDILVIAQKIVSKAEGRFVNLASLAPSKKAKELAEICRKDPRLVEAVLQESSEVLRCSENFLIVVHRLGYVVANAAIDASNVAAEDGEMVLLLPRQPDQSAADIRDRLSAMCGIAPGIIINDSFGRAWRQGTIGTAIGAAGVASLEDLRGRSDLFGRTLVATEVATADQLASAATLIQGQADEGVPIVLVRGFVTRSPHISAAILVRPVEKDMFR